MIKKSISFGIVLIIIAGSIAGSYFFSSVVYKFYIRSYYYALNSDKYEEYYNEAVKMLEEGEFEDFEDFSSKIIIAYPKPAEFYKITGNYFYNKGDREKGVMYLLKYSQTTGEITDELNLILPYLYENKLFGEIVGELKKNEEKLDNMQCFYYGAALLENGENLKSEKFLDKALLTQVNNADLFYYKAKSLIGKKMKPGEKKNIYKQALYYTAKAYSFSKKSMISKLYIYLLKENGDYEKAALVLQRK